MRPRMAMTTAASWDGSRRPVDADLRDQSLLPWLREGRRVGAAKSLGELLERFVGPALRDSGFAVEDSVDLGVVAILHGRGSSAPCPACRHKNSPQANFWLECGPAW